jgi:hypothetical protein
VRSLQQRREACEREVEVLWPSSPWAETIARLRCLRGIDTLTALGLCAEAGDLRRFKRPSALTGHFGIVGRLTARPSPTGRGGQLLPPPAPRRGPPRAPPVRRRPAGARDRLAGPAPPALSLAPSAQGAGQARQRGAGRLGAGARLLRLGGGAAGLRHPQRLRPRRCRGGTRQERPARRCRRACDASSGSGQMDRPPRPLQDCRPGDESAVMG